MLEVDDIITYHNDNGDKICVTAGANGIAKAICGGLYMVVYCVAL